jgi:hypothetical protein
VQSSRVPIPTTFPITPAIAVIVSPMRSQPLHGSASNSVTQKVHYNCLRDVTPRRAPFISPFANTTCAQTTTQSRIGSGGAERARWSVSKRPPIPNVDSVLSTQSSVCERSVSRVDTAVDAYALSRRCRPSNLLGPLVILVSRLILCSNSTHAVLNNSFSDYEPQLLT